LRYREEPVTPTSVGAVGAHCLGRSELVGPASFHALAAETIAVYDRAPVDERGSLVNELFRRFEELTDHRERIAVAPSASTVAEAVGLGMKIIGRLTPAPRSINLTASDEGDVLFTLFGPTGREAELWLGSTPGSYSYVLVEGGKISDGTLPATEFEPIAAWLA
jgi:hypothetical protein